MIDIEQDVFNSVASVLRNKFPDIFVSGEAVDSPAKFPAVTIIENDNSVYTKMSTDNLENAVSLMYEVNVYTNEISHRKMKAKEIMSLICEEFEKIGFTRTACGPVTNFQDDRIYRMVARFTAKADKDFWIYQS